MTRYTVAFLLTNLSQTLLLLLGEICIFVRSYCQIRKFKCVAYLRSGFYETIKTEWTHGKSSQRNCNAIIIKNECFWFLFVCFLFMLIGYRGMGKIPNIIDRGCFNLFFTRRQIANFSAKSLVLHFSSFLCPHLYCHLHNKHRVYLTMRKKKQFSKWRFSDIKLFL